MDSSYPLYRVKPGCEIAHEDVEYQAGAELPLSPELALFHAHNIELAKRPKEKAIKGVASAD